MIVLKMRTKPSGRPQLVETLFGAYRRRILALLLLLHVEFPGS